MTNKAMTMTLELLKDAFEYAKIPTSFYEEKKVIYKLDDAILPLRALDRRLQVDWARDPREGPRVLVSLSVDFEPMG